jgi:DNA-binding transcriptional MerR regulator
MGQIKTFTIGEVADRTGMSVHALRYYERHGLLAVDVARTSSGHRRYCDADVEWIEVCCQLRRSRMPLNTLREYVQLVRDGPGNEQQRLAVLRRHESQVRAEVEVLRASLELISYKVSFYEKRVADGTATNVWAAQ